MLNRHCVFLMLLVCMSAWAAPSENGAVVPMADFTVEVQLDTQPQVDVKQFLDAVFTFTTAPVDSGLKSLEFPLRWLNQFPNDYYKMASFVSELNQSRDRLLKISQDESAPDALEKEKLKFATQVRGIWTDRSQKLDLKKYLILRDKYVQKIENLGQEFVDQLEDLEEVDGISSERFKDLTAQIEPFLQELERVQRNKLNESLEDNVHEDTNEQRKERFLTRQAELKEAATHATSARSSSQQQSQESVRHFSGTQSDAVVDASPDLLLSADQECDLKSALRVYDNAYKSWVGISFKIKMQILNSIQGQDSDEKRAILKQFSNQYFGFSRLARASRTYQRVIAAIEQLDRVASLSGAFPQGHRITPDEVRAILKAQAVLTARMR